VAYDESTASNEPSYSVPPHILYLDVSEVAFVQFVVVVPNHHSVAQILGIAVCVDVKVADLDRSYVAAVDCSYIILR
jgi:hypothetical protein